MTSRGPLPAAAAGSSSAAAAGSSGAAAGSGGASTDFVAHEPSVLFRCCQWQSERVW
jgi:hypothetical protein